MFPKWIDSKAVRMVNWRGWRIFDGISSRDNLAELTSVLEGPLLLWFGFGNFRHSKTFIVTFPKKISKGASSRFLAKKFCLSIQRANSIQRILCRNHQATQKACRDQRSKKRKNWPMLLPVVKCVYLRRLRNKQATVVRYLASHVVGGRGFASLLFT